MPTLRTESPWERGNSPGACDLVSVPPVPPPCFPSAKSFPSGGSLCSTCSPSDERFPSWFPLFHLQRGWPSEIENFSRVSSERAYAERPPPQAHMRRLNGTALEIRIRLPLRTSCACKGIHEQRAWRLQAVSAIQPYLGRTNSAQEGTASPEPRGYSMKSARLLALAGAAIVLAGCAQNNLPTGSARSQVPIPSSTMALMARKACRRATRS